MPQNKIALAGKSEAGHSAAKVPLPERLQAAIVTPYLLICPNQALASR